MLPVCYLAGKKGLVKHHTTKPLEGRMIFLDLVGRKNYVSFEKKLKLLGAVRTAQCFSIFSLKWKLFAEILIAHGTHGRRQEFVSEHREIRGRERGRGSWRGGSKLVGLGERCKLSQWSSGESPNFKCILDALRAQKMRLKWPQMSFSSGFYSASA